VIHCDGRSITAQDLGLIARPVSGGSVPVNIPTTREELRLAKQTVRQAAADELERQFVTAALERSGGNVSKAARQTGLQRSNLQALIKKHGIRVVR
jgi:DNA-binding NtrC family response regulator